MELNRKVYYGIEILSFLSSSPNEAWNSTEIAFVIALDNVTKFVFKSVNPQTSLPEVREKLVIAMGEKKKPRDQKKIQEVLRSLRGAGLINRVGRGYEINDAGKKASLLQIMQAVGQPLRVAECIADKKGEGMAKQTPSFDCPKRDTAACQSYFAYCWLNKHLEDLFSQITITDLLDRKSFIEVVKKLTFPTPSSLP